MLDQFCDDLLLDHSVNIRRQGLLNFLVCSPEWGLIVQSQTGSPIVFSIFTDNLNDETECTLTKFMDNIKLKESQIHYKEEPPYRETSTCWKTKPTRTVQDLTKINIKSYTWDGIIPHSSNSWGLTALICSSAEDDLTVLLESKLTMSEQHALAAMKINLRNLSEMTLTVYHNTLLSFECNCLYTSFAINYLLYD